MKVEARIHETGNDGWHRLPHVVEHYQVGGGRSVSVGQGDTSDRPMRNEAGHPAAPDEHVVIRPVGGDGDTAPGEPLSGADRPGLIEARGVRGPGR